MANRDDEKNPDEYVSEEFIAANFKAYRSYLEQHVHISDLIVYYEPFTDGMVFKLYERKTCEQVIGISDECLWNMHISILSWNSSET